MRAYKPSCFGEAGASQEDPLQEEDRAGRIPLYAQRVAKGEPLFEKPKPVPALIPCQASQEPAMQ